jgi:hypothetical protein
MPLAPGDPESPAPDVDFDPIQFDYPFKEAIPVATI